jgi:hypothetical protein
MESGLRLPSISQLAQGAPTGAIAHTAANTDR